MHEQAPLAADSSCCRALHQKMTGSGQSAHLLHLAGSEHQLL